MIVKIQGVSELQNQIYYDYDTDSVPLGQGGMGIVYPGRCFKQDNPNEYIPVAVKLITNTNREMIERAMRESSIQIDHPNLLRMYGFIPNMEMDPFSHEMKPRYYIVMELLDGVSLESLLEGVFCARNGSDISYARELYDLSMRNRKEFTLKMMRPILSGVSRLHEAGYIHRDIDPSNVMITQDGGVKIIDYGVCKPVSSAAGTVKLTMTGSIIGKVDYAAPELLSGDVQHHNFTTDVYALGILAYQLYTGSLPFTGDNSTVMKAHLSEDVPVGRIQDPVIRHVVEKAVSKAQSDRYQTVEQMWQDLYDDNLNDIRKSAQADGQEQHGDSYENIADTASGSRSAGRRARSRVALWIVSAVVGLGAGVVTGFMI
ncbi:MAG TPA: serine/threonine protein kinase [Candidatus Coprenecus pullistercoris]|nr:serine/threonine protein kinase [Candidatus Coprenecus pullistercoris]